MKIDLEEVENILLQHKVSDTPAILKDLETVIEELKAERDANKVQKNKWEFLVILNDPTGKLKEAKMDESLTAYVIKQEEGEDAGSIFTKLADAARQQNEAAKKKKSRLANIRDIFEALKPKFLKDKKLKISTKEPVRILFPHEPTGIW